MRRLLRLTLLFAVLSTALLVFTAFWLHRNPDALARHLAEAVQERTGIACQLENVAVVLLPVPSLGISDIHMQAQGMAFRVAYATVRPALLPLLRGEFSPGNITLLRPQLVWSASAPQPPPPTAASPLSPDAPVPPSPAPWAPPTLPSLAVIPDLLDNARIQIMHGSLRYDFSPARSLYMDGINTDLSLQAPDGLSGSLTLGSTALWQDDKVLWTVDALTLQVGGSLLSLPQGAPARLSLDTRAQLPGLAHNATLRLDLSQRVPLDEEQPRLDMTVDMEARLIWPEQAQPQTGQSTEGLPLSLRGSVQAAGGTQFWEQGLQLRHMRLALDQDRMTFNGALGVPPGETAPRLSGRLDIQRLSLTQWFGFARQMPPGLQQTLHNIRGFLNFSMDAQGLDVPQISAQAVDAQFTGRGGVQSWSQPVIELDLGAPALTLDLALPEAVGQSPKAPPLPNAPFTPVPGSAEAKAMTGPDIDYDIKLRVDKLAYGPLRLENAAFRCLPEEAEQPVQASLGTATTMVPPVPAASRQGKTAKERGKEKGKDSARNNAKDILPKKTPEAGVLMTFGVGQVYGGNGEGRLVLRSPAPGKTSYGVKAALKNVHMEALLASWNASPPKEGATARNSKESKDSKSNKGGKNAAPLPFLGGRLHLDTEFTAQGRSLAAFFATQSGSVQARLDQGYILVDADKKDKLPFQRLQWESRVRGSCEPTSSADTGKGRSPASRLPAELSYTGLWKLNMDAPLLKASFQLDGPISFATKGFLPLRVSKVPGRLTLEPAGSEKSPERSPDKSPEKSQGGESLSADQFKAEATGLFSLHSGQRLLALDEGRISLPALADLVLKGSVRTQLAPQGPHIQGNLEAQTPRARRLLRLLVPAMADALPATALGPAEAHAQFSYQDRELHLSQIRANVDGLTAKGSLSGTWKARPTWKFDLSADTLDLDRYLPPKGGAKTAPKGAGTRMVTARPVTTGKLTAASAPPAAVAVPVPAPASLAVVPASKPWNLDWMRRLDLQGNLHIQSLRVRKLTLRNARLPLRLQDGALDCSGIRAQLYGAEAVGQLRSAPPTAQGLKLNMSLEAQGIHMLALSEDRGMHTALSGQGALWINLQGTLRNADHIPAALDGAWRLRLDNAATQSRNSKGALTGSPTLLGVVQASGSVEKGVLRSDNLTIAGPTLQAKGSGWVNLDKDTMDVDLNVNMQNLPEFPVRFHGSLDNPQRSINAGRVIAAALGNLGLGVVDAVGTVLGGAFRLLP